MSGSVSNMIYVFCVGFMCVSAVRKGDVGFLYDHSSQMCVGVGQ